MLQSEANDHWIEIDGCFEHPEGCRVWRIMLGATEVWVARFPTGQMFGPAGTPKRAMPSLPLYIPQGCSPYAWAATSKNRVWDLTATLSPEFPEIYTGTVGIWKIQVREQRAFYVLTKNEILEEFYLVEEHSLALGGAHYLYYYGRVNDD